MDFVRSESIDGSISGGGGSSMLMKSFWDAGGGGCSSGGGESSSCRSSSIGLAPGDSWISDRGSLICVIGATAVEISCADGDKANWLGIDVGGALYELVQLAPIY